MSSRNIPADKVGTPFLSILLFRGPTWQPLYESLKSGVDCKDKL